MFRKGTKLPSGVSAPEEASLGEVSLSNIIDTNGHEVVVFNSYDLKHNDPLNLRAIKLLTNKNMLNELTFIFWLPFEMTPIYYPHAV